MTFTIVQRGDTVTAEIVTRRLDGTQSPVETITSGPFWDVYDERGKLLGTDTTPEGARGMVTNAMMGAAPKRLPT